MTKPPPPQDALTRREHSILERLAAGQADQQIAAELFLSVNTIRWYNRQIYSKLGVGNRSQAAARARELGLLTPQAPAPTLPRPSLPLPATSFIGRRREIAETAQLLRSTRLLTLTGVGGTGKTRLALRLLAELQHNFADGLYFVDLAPLKEPDMLAKSIATVLDVFEQANEAPADTLKRVLAGREMLLLLDNFEHLIGAAPLLAALLAAAPGLRFLVTSREALRLSGEQEYPVLPLSLPPTEGVSVQALLDSEAGALFVQRLQQQQPHFRLDERKAATIAQICQRLDGLPLAIELAAARCRMLSPEALLRRLDKPLQLLTGGARDVPARQQTLRNTIAWSYALLSAEEKTLFARLAVFRGGRALDAIEHVCGQGLASDLLDGLASLVDKSLLQQAETEAGEPRFTMLESIQDYAWECLERSGEADQLRRRHAEYFAALAEAAEPELRSHPHMRWFQCFALEQDNFRQALLWSLEGGEVHLGLRLATALYLFWFAYGHHLEGQRWMQRLLPYLDDAPETLQARFLIGAGNMAMASDFAMAKPLFRRALDLARRLGEQVDAAWALAHLASITEASAEAMSLAQEALALFRVLKQQPGAAYSLNVIGEIARRAGEDAQARQAYEACLALCLETGESRRVAIIYFNLAFLSQHAGDHVAALDFARQALAIAQRMNNRGEMAWALPIIADSLAALGQPQRAARLLGLSASFLEGLGAFIMPGDKAEFDRIHRTLHQQLGAVGLRAALAEGRRMSLAAAVAYALADPPPPDEDPPIP